MRKTVHVLVVAGVAAISLAAAAPPADPAAPAKLAGETDSALSAHLACHALYLADGAACSDHTDRTDISESCNKWVAWLPKARANTKQAMEQCGPDTGEDCAWRNQALKALQAGDAAACPEPLRCACRVVLGQGEEDVCGTPLEHLGKRLNKGFEGRALWLPPVKKEAVAPVPGPTPPPADLGQQAHKLRTALEESRLAHKHAKRAIELAGDWTNAEQKTASMDGTARAMEERKLRHLEFLTDGELNQAERRIESAMSLLRECLPLTSAEAKTAFEEAQYAEAAARKARLAAKEAAALAAKRRAGPAPVPNKTQ